MLAGVAGQAVAGEPLDERDQLFVPSEDLLEKRHPTRTGRSGVIFDAGSERDQIRWVVGSQLSVPQFKGAVRAGEQPRVAVELVKLERDLGLGGGEREHGADAGLGLGRERPLHGRFAFVGVVDRDGAIEQSADRLFRCSVSVAGSVAAEPRLVI